MGGTEVVIGLAIAGAAMSVKASQQQNKALEHLANSAVLNPRNVGDEFWPMITYVKYYPDLECIVKVPLAQPIDLDETSIPGRTPWFPTFMRWMTLGISPAPKDCVSTVI